MSEKIVPANSQNIRQAADLLLKGHLVAFPTETVYGLGANALDQSAVAKIFTAKGRPSNNPLIIHVATVDQAKECASIPSHFEELVHSLARSFWPGPLTLVLPKQNHISNLVTAGRNSVAVRIPDHPVALELLRITAVPIAAPSANRSNYVSPTEASHVSSCLGESVSCILDAGPTRIGIESTVLSLLQDNPLLLRFGGVTKEQIEEAIGSPVLHRSHLQSGESEPLSPGQLPIHYSPHTPVRQLSTSSRPSRFENVGVILFDEPGSGFNRDLYSCVTVIGSNECPEDVGAALYRTLREHDQRGLDRILIDDLPENGIGAAIMDRIRRASGRSD